MEPAPLSATDFASAVTAITSAFGDPTRRDIYLFVRDQQQAVTASEVAERFDLHPNVARHHLDKLTSGGYMEVSTERTGTGAGRPSKRFQVAADATLELPVRHDELVITMLARALSLLPTDVAEAMAEEVGADYGRALAAALAPQAPATGDDVPTSAGTVDKVQRSVRSAVGAVAEALTAHGFATHAEGKRGGELRLISDHCPFGDTAIEHPVMCAVDRGLVKGMLAELYGDTEAITESSLPMGDRRCITSVTG